MKTVKLGDVLEKTVTIKWRDMANDKEFAYIDLTSVDRDTHTIDVTQIINATNAPSRAQKIVQTEDVLFGTTRPTLNRLCIVSEEYEGQICSTGLCVLRAITTQILPNYIYYLLTTSDFVVYIEETQRGTSYPAVTDSDVKDFEFALPSIEEQREVVTRLDDAFERIDRAIELTQQNIENTQKLWSAALSEMIKNDNATIVAKLGDICEVISRGISPKYTEDKKGVTVLNQRCIRGNKILLEYSRKHDVVAKKVQTVKYVKSGDVLVNSTGQGTLGRTAIAKDVNHPMLVDSHVTIIRPKYGIFESRYLAYLISMCEADFIALATGTSGQTELPRIALAEYKIIYDESIDRQLIAAEKLNNTDTKINKVIVRYSKKLKYLKALKQSLLEQAFTENGVK